MSAESTEWIERGLHKLRGRITDLEDRLQELERQVNDLRIKASKTQAVVRDGERDESI